MTDDEFNRLSDGSCKYEIDELREENRALKMRLQEREEMVEKYMALVRGHMALAEATRRREERASRLHLNQRLEIE